MCDRHQAGRPVHRRTEIVAVPFLDLPRVQPHSHADRRPVRPRFSRQCHLSLYGGCDRIRSPLEGNPEPVSTGGKHMPAMSLDRSSEQLVMAG